MANKPKVGPAEIGNSCKGVYKRYLTLLRTAGIPMDKVEEILSGENYDDALAAFALLTATGKWSKVMTNMISMCGTTILNDVFDILWFYRRNLHFRVESIPDIDIFDTTILNEIKRDICLDIEIDGEPYGVYLFHRDYPIELKKDSLDWTAQVFAYTPSITSQSAYIVARAASRPAYTMHFAASENTRRCYIEHNNQYKTDCEEVCDKCNKCTKTHISYGCTEADFRLHPFRYRLENGCDFSKYIPVTVATKAKGDKNTIFFVIQPTDVLKCILHALECYKAREVITRKNGKKAAAYNACRVHIASKRDNSSDKIVMLPLHEYVKEYRESHPYEYKGGHHASPVAHMRRGYYRKARKHGDYIKRGDEFIYVGNGEGDYCFVRATQVNNKTDRVIVYQATDKKSEKK